MNLFVANVRNEKGLTQAELSRRSGVAVSHIHNIENGTKMPTIKVLCKLAKALEVDCSELYDCDN